MDVFFVADDFTGGVDVLLQAARCGESATMFLSEEAFAAADAEEMRACTGVATTFRRMAPEDVEAPLGRILDSALAHQPRVVQFKICSTADSAPTRGSIRPPFEAFLARGATRVPLLAAQPGLRRYTAFAHHFAHDRGAVYRLDRQPTMSNHPSTPMRESDLRVHFAEQVGEEVGSITLEDLLSPDSLRSAWRRETAAGRRLVVLDTVHPDHLAAHGILLTEDEPAYVIGSGGSTLALGAGLGWREDPAASVPAHAAEGPVLVVAGSCSQLTAAQIARVADRPDWEVLSWDPRGADLGELAERATALLSAGKHVVVHSGGASVEQTERAVGQADPGDGAGDLATVVPDGLAQVALAAAGMFSRLVVAGGDTSGDVLTRLGAVKLTTLAVLDHDTCLCLVTGAMGEGAMEVVLKGGQIGTLDFFIKAADGEGERGHGDQQA